MWRDSARELPHNFAEGREDSGGQVGKTSREENREKFGRTSREDSGGVTRVDMPGAAGGNSSGAALVTP